MRQDTVQKDGECDVAGPRRSPHIRVTPLLRHLPSAALHLSLISVRSLPCLTCLCFGPQHDQTVINMNDNTWRPPSPPESVASFSSTVSPFDSVSQVGWRPPRQHRHHNHSRRADQESRSGPRPYAQWKNVEVYGARSQHDRSRNSSARPATEVHHPRSRASRPRSNSPSTRPSWVNSARTSTALSELRSDSSIRTPTASLHPQSSLASDSQTISRSSGLTEQPAPPSAHLIDEEVRTRHCLPRPRATTVNKAGAEEYEVVQVELDSDEEEGSYHILRTHRYPVHTRG